MSDDANQPSSNGTLQVATLEAFAAVNEPGARELVGEPGQALIPEGGNVMLYGDGGAGKTTLGIDLGCHMAAASEWLGIAVGVASRCLLIEDEGPRPYFRRKVATKLAAWRQDELAGRVLVVVEPWAAFTFARESHRQALAELIDHHALGVVIVGPVVVAGMEKAGTLQEVREFLALLDDVRQRCGRVVTFVLVHHENKGGAVSGAWEGAGDTLMHLSAQGPGKSRLHFQKARHAPDYHLATLTLEWTEGDGFAVSENDAPTDEDIEAKLLAAIAADPGIGWTAASKRVQGVRDSRRRAVRDRLLERGVVVNVGRENGAEVVLDYCQERKPARLYLADDPSIAHLVRSEPLF